MTMAHVDAGSSGGGGTPPPATAVMPMVGEGGGGLACIRVVAAKSTMLGGKVNNCVCAHTPYPPVPWEAPPTPAQPHSRAPRAWRGGGKANTPSAREACWADRCFLLHASDFTFTQGKCDSPNARLFGSTMPPFFRLSFEQVAPPKDELSP